MVGALLVLVGMSSVFAGGIAWLIEMDGVSSAIESRTSDQTTPLLLSGVALTLVGGVVLLWPARRFA
jgi:hypothetical protein